MEVANDLHATCQKTSASMMAKIRKDCSGLAIILFFMLLPVLTLAPANVHGINSCTPGEVLHQLQQGWITISIDKFYKDILTKKQFLDLLSGQVSGLLSHENDRDYP
jgi:hypothetical protein